MTVQQRVEAALVRSVGALPSRVKRAMVGSPLQRDGLELDLDVQLLLKLVAVRPREPYEGRAPAEVREELREAVQSIEGPPLRAVSVTEESIEGAAGSLRARLYTPQESAGRTTPLLVYFHGGGWVAGDLDTHDQPCRLLARTSGARVLSVDYRLAPEHPFPAPVDDAIAAFRSAVREAGRLGADPARVAVGGDSAGGHLAAVVAQQCALDGGPAPALQLLIYPVTDCVATSASRVTFAEGFVLSRADMQWYEDRFAGDAPDRSDPRFSPLYGERLAGVAPAIVVTAGFDPLRDEGEAYAARLRDAGVPTLLRRFDGYVHGFIHAFVTGTGPRESVAEIGGAVRALLR